ncbi:hypothetical protein [Micromonospora thermarum]|uniref:hypothetical protein n=1 Tax=Micromonospora thermarum TaxID=2720024 RepID=UPI001F0E1306|nr:hypothetical protein [Micromonospora thermarum]
MLATPLLPAGLPVLLALAGPAVLAVRSVRRAASTGQAAPPPATHTAPPTGPAGGAGDTVATAAGVPARWEGERPCGWR